MDGPFLDIHVTKLYPEFAMQVDLGVEQGEFFSLVGPSGCGKTTLLRLIAGLETADQGVISLDGREITNIPAASRQVGLVFQEYALFPHLNVTQNIEYGLQVQKMPSKQRKKRIMELLSLFELEALATREMHQLSGGERQRVAFARALAPNPLLLLMDEPFSALDYGLRQRLQKDLRQIQKDLGFTAIFVTHQQEEALSLSNRLGVMQNGRVSQVGTPQEIYEKPSNRFVAEFLGETNLIPCSLEHMADKSFIDIGHGYPLEFPRLTNYPSGNYLLMVRPEDLHIGEFFGPTFQVEIIRLEYLGFSYRMEACCGQHRIKALMGKNIDNLKTGEQVRLGINPQSIRLIPE
jgi:ABC-type Fe3+/spermidine/putrescine transport system ATPase subunit